MNYADRVKDTSASVGTGPITLFGAPITGFRSFLSVFPSGAVDVPYAIDDGAGNWEIGIGSFADSVLTRTQVLSSSSNGGLVDFVAGKKSVICTLPADLVESATNRSIAAASESAGHAEQTALDRAQTALDRAATAADHLATSADVVATAEERTLAQQAATSASASAATAVERATAAEASATAAAGSATTATTKATAAAASEVNALASKNAAANSEANALASKNAAVTSATNAATSEANALASKNAAATSATNAANSATSAANSATTATAQASNAATSATNAANSATAAAGSATLAQQFAESITPTTSLQKADKASPCLVKTGGGTLAVKAGTTVYLSGGVVSFASQTAITMPALTAGEDYSVWVLPNGTAQAVADPFFAPASAPAAGALKIGGFHYGLVAPGTTPAGGLFATSGFSNTGGNMVWTQADVDRIAGINEFSIWDLVFRSAGEQHGMAFDQQTRVWWGIYLCSTNHIANGISRYNTDVASGTVLPRIPLVFGGNGTNTYGRLSLYEAVEIAASHNCRLPSYEEFMSAAFGVTEGQSIGGATSTIPATTRQAGYTSRIGMEQATGHHWIIGAPFGSSGGSAWSGTGRGSLYGTTGLPLFGGSRSGAADSGSRCSRWDFVAWSSGWGIGLRAACDHLNL